jgi:hypothetical protein
MADEARLEETGPGLAPAGEGWFVVNVREAAWRTSDAFGDDSVLGSLLVEGATHLRAVFIITPERVQAVRDALEQKVFPVLRGEPTSILAPVGGPTAPSTSNRLTRALAHSSERSRRPQGLQLSRSDLLGPLIHE